MRRKTLFAVAGLAALLLLGGGAVSLLARAPARVPVGAAFAVTLLPQPRVPVAIEPTPAVVATAQPATATATAVVAAATVPPEPTPPPASPTLALIPLIAPATSTAAPPVISSAPALQVAPTVTPIPIVPASGCPVASTAGYGLISSDGAYKSNRLTDYNADLRLSVLGYGPPDPQAAFGLIDYNGETDPNAPRLHGLFEPNRVPSVSAAYQRYNWGWDENSTAPYGNRSGLNAEWSASVVAFSTSPGEGIYPPERNPEIGGGYIAMLLYAGETELTLAYHRQDSVTDGYVVHVLGVCVDANLLALYRAQTAGGLRSSGQLPAVSNNQRLGTAQGASITVAIRDRGVFLDPRSRKDWWQ